MIGLVLMEQELVREEKRRFYLSQVERLQSAGLNARIFEYDGSSGSLPGSGWLAVFDIDCRRHLCPVLDQLGVQQAPIVWNPYLFFEKGHDLVRTSERIVAAIAPGATWGSRLRRYPLGKPIYEITIAADLNPCAEPAGQGAVSRIGYFPTGQRLVGYIRGVMVRTYPEFRELEWVEIDYTDPEAWGSAFTKCELFLSLRDLSGSALPLLDLMTSGVIVCGIHGGGLRELASPENGIWVDSANADKLTEAVIDGLTRLNSDEDWRKALLANARASAEAVSAEATFAGNHAVWKELAALAASGS